MHLVIGITLITFAIGHGDIKKWRQFQKTMLYVSYLVLLYNLLCSDKLLWVHNGDIIKSRKLLEVIHCTIILPFTALLYLSSFPSTLKQSIHYLTKWVVCSLIIEWILVKMNYIVFYHGYKFWMEIPFYITMYCLIRLHHLRPLLTYMISIIIIIFLMNVFHIPLK